MSIKNATVMVCHIAGDPRLTYSEKTGTPRFYARVGVDHWRREEDGTFTKLDRTFHDLSLRYKAAEVAKELYRKGDNVIATGKFEKFPDPETGVEREEFRADTLTPNPVSGRITINREPRNATVERDAAGVDRNQAFERPDQSPQAREPAVLGS